MVREGFFAAVDVVHLMKVQELKVYSYNMNKKAGTDDYLKIGAKE